MRTFPLLIIFLFSCLMAGAQQDVRYLEDSQIRGHFNLEAGLGKKFTIHLDQQYRITNNISQLTRASADIGLTYKVSDHVKLLADYIYIQRRSNSGMWRQRNWYSGGIVLRTDAGYWRFVARSIVQARNGNTNSDKEYLTKWYNRNKLSIRYSVNKRVSAFVAGEIYIPLNNPQFQGIDRVRGITGVVIKTFKKQELELHFMYQQWLSRGGWWDANDNAYDRMLRKTYILGIGYGIELW
jgi:hypothetical protein